MHRRSIVLVTPALADANNGNWRTAQRWARMLSPAYRVTLAAQWPDQTRPDAGFDAMIALHARRSAPSMMAWKHRQPQAPLLLALTGTDLYRDIETDAQAQRCLGLADALVVLNEIGACRLPPPQRARCHVVLQSCSARAQRPRPRGHLKAVAVGHLRPEKDPLTLLRAASRLTARTDIRIDHVGRALDNDLGERARAVAASGAPYRWLGERPHEEVRRRIAAAHVLVHPSRMEGGAHVVIEALRSGTPVLASRVDGNVGLLGADYAGYFDAGDDRGLAQLLQRARDEPAYLAGLQRQARARAGRFSAAAERRALHAAVRAAIRHHHDP